MIKNLFLFQKIFDDYVDPLVIFDQKGQIEYSNKRWDDFSGYKLKELVGKPLFVLISGQEKRKIDNLIKKEIKETRELSTFFLAKNKKEIPIVLSIMSLTDKKDKFIGGLAIFSGAEADKTKSELGILQKAQEEAEEGRMVLEVKVKAKTKALREINETLEDQVTERTKELQEQIDELEQWRKMAVGRELKMAELKEKNKKLELKLKKKL